MVSNRNLIEAAVTQDLFGPVSLTQPAELEVPEKYELLECLGHGGFGVVYKARDTTLDRLVALKFLSGCRPADVERFRREARFAARLSDPAIVPVFEFGYAADRPFIAMQYIDGGSLATANLTPQRILHVVRDMAAALHQAHVAGLVHRDFKPANVLLDRTGRAYLSDFGIAHDLSDPGGATVSLEGLVVGTPALMSPEQARGEGHSIDARSDIYSVGASLYLLLCGRYPFERASMVDLLHAVIHDDPPMPRSINPAIPRPVEAIILKCMHKERRERYQSAADLIRDLGDHLGGRGVEGEQAAWFRKLVGASPPRPSSEPDLFETLGMEMLREIAAWDADLYRVSRNVARLYPRLDAVIQRLSTVLAQFPHFAWARFYRGLALFRRGRLPEALDDMERSIDRLGSRASAHFEIGQLYLTLYLREQRLAYKHISPTGTHAHLSESRGRLHQAVVAFEEARRLSYDLPAWQLEFARAVSRLAEQDHAGCVAICDHILREDPDVGEVWRMRGDALRLAGQDPCSSYDQALRVRHSDYQSCLCKAEALLHRGRIADARSCLQQALEIYPDLATAHALLAWTHLAESRALPGTNTQARAEPLAIGVQIARRARTLDPGDYDAAVTLGELLLEEVRLNDGTQSLEEARRVLEQAKELPGCQNRVRTLLARGHLEDARLRRLTGGDPRPELECVLDLSREPLQHLPDDPTWIGLVSEARRQLDELGDGLEPGAENDQGRPRA